MATQISIISSKKEEKRSLETKWYVFWHKLNFPEGF